MSATLEVTVSGEGASIRTWAARTDQLAAELDAALAADDVRAARTVSISIATPAGSSPDAGWVIERACATPRERIFVTGKLVTYRALTTIAELGSWTTHATFTGTFSGLRWLDLRDGEVTWHDATFPDVEVISLRPRGHADKAREWTAALFARPAMVPAARVLRIREGRGDDMLASLCTSSLLAQLRVLDLTDVLTNRGAQIMAAEAERFMHLEQIWIGSFPPPPMHGVPRAPRGELDIDDAWRSRLRAKLGKRLRFKPPPGHPNLGTVR